MCSHINEKLIFSAEIKLQPAVAYAIPAANKNKLTLIFEFQMIVQLRSVPSLFERSQKRAGRSSLKSSSRKYKK